MATLVYDCIYSILFFIVGIYVYIASSSFSNQKSHYVEIVCFAIFISSIINLIMAANKLFKKKYESGSGFKFSKKLIIFSLLALAFSILVNYFGFCLPAILFIFSCSCLLRPQNKIKALIVSVLIVTTLYVIFHYFLNINFPQGIFVEQIFYR